MAIEPLSSKEQSPRALIERLHGYVTGVSDRKGYIEALQEIEARLTPETVCELNALERLLVEWWNSDMESAELFNRAVLTNPALASAMNTDRCKSGGTDGSCALHEGHGGPHALRSPEKAGAFCSRCGGTDPACYICGSNAQKTSSPLCAPKCMDWPKCECGRGMP